MKKINYIVLFIFTLNCVFSEKIYNQAELSILSGSVLLKKKGIDGVIRYSRNVLVHLNDDIQTSRDFRGVLILENNSRISLEWGKLYRWREQGFFLIEKNKWLRLGELRESSYQKNGSFEAGTIGKVFVRGWVDVTRPKEFQHRRLTNQFNLVRGDVIEVLGASQVGIEMAGGVKVDLGKQTLIEVLEYGIFLRNGFVSVLGNKTKQFEIVTSDFSIMGRTDEYQYEVFKDNRTHVRNLLGVSKVIDKKGLKFKFLKPRMEITSNSRSNLRVRAVPFEKRARLSPENINDYSNKSGVIADLTDIQKEHQRIYKDIELQLKGEFVTKKPKKLNTEVAGKKYLRRIKEIDKENWDKREWFLERRLKKLPLEPNDFVKESRIDANDFETKRDQKYFRERNLSSSIRTRIQQEIIDRRSKGKSLTDGQGKLRSSARILELRDFLNRNKLNQSKILNEKNRLERQKFDIDRKLALTDKPENRIALSILKREIVVRLNRINSDSRNIALIISQINRELIREKASFNTRLARESDFERRSRQLVQ
ncbi:MAG: hypothetical protein COB02_06275 [Candidatus Cloacimonadota bacterium]|nr:MAG: hypothetical protein COB02_06275 [Candidatus Cloacimonadota bacterium]